MKSATVISPAISVRMPCSLWRVRERTNSALSRSVFEGIVPQLTRFPPTTWARSTTATRLSGAGRLDRCPLAGRPAAQDDDVEVRHLTSSPERPFYAGLPVSPAWCPVSWLIGPLREVTATGAGAQPGRLGPGSHLALDVGLGRGLLAWHVGCSRQGAGREAASRRWPMPSGSAGVKDHARKLSALVWIEDGAARISGAGGRDGHQRGPPGRGSPRRPGSARATRSRFDSRSSVAPRRSR